MARRNASYQQLFLDSLGGFGESAMKAGSVVGDHNRAEAENTRQDAESKARLGLVGEQTRGAKTDADSKGLDYDRSLQKSNLEKSMLGGLDSFSADPLAADAKLASMALGRTVTPEELRTQRGREEKVKGLEVEEKEFGLGEKKNKAGRDAAESLAGIGETAARTKLLGAQTEKAGAEAKAAGEPNKGKPPTESQSNSALFGRRLELAMRDMDEIKTGGHDAASVGAGLNRAASKMPGGNLMASDNTQRQKNAETNFLTAVLRKESGASISPSEFGTGEQLYFERTGDSDAVKEQKARNRAQALAGLKAGSGSAWETVQLTPAGEKPAAGGLDAADPKVKAALAAGYSEDEIRAYLGKGK
jgi:hypothetical protein